MPNKVDLIDKAQELEDGEYVSMFFDEASEVLGEPIVEDEGNEFDVFAPSTFLPASSNAAALPSQPTSLPLQAFETLQRPEPGMAIDTLARVGYPYMDTDPSGAGLRSWLRQLIRQL